MAPSSRRSAGTCRSTEDSLSSSVARPGVSLSAFSNDGTLTRTRITTVGGAIDIEGTSGGGAGVQVANSDLQTQTGAMTLTGTSSDGSGVRIAASNLETHTGPVTITGSTGDPSVANGVQLDAGTVITKSAGSAATTVQVNSTGDISIADGVQFASLLGSLNVALNARPFGSGDTTRPSRISIGNLVQFLTGGGSITMYGSDNPASGAAGAITLGSATLDTRPLSGTGTGGVVTMRAGADGIQALNAEIQTQGGAITLDGIDTTGSTTTGVALTGTTVDAGTGDISIQGSAGSAPSGSTGVSLISSVFPGSGSVRIVGLAAASGTRSVGAALQGVDIQPAAGSIAILGRATPSPGGSSGILLESAGTAPTVLAAPGAGARIELTGSSEGTGATGNDHGISVAGTQIGSATATSDILIRGAQLGWCGGDFGRFWRQHRHARRRKHPARAGNTPRGSGRTRRRNRSRLEELQVLM